MDPAGDEPPGRMADLASTGYQGVKTTLRLVERATDVFPPLKSTAGGLLGVIDIVEVRDFQLNIVIVMVLTVPIFADNRPEPTRSPRSGAEAESRRLDHQQSYQLFYHAQFLQPSRGSFVVGSCQCYLGNPD